MVINLISVIFSHLKPSAGIVGELVAASGPHELAVAEVVAMLIELGAINFPLARVVENAGVPLQEHLCIHLVERRGERSHAVRAELVLSDILVEVLRHILTIKPKCCFCVACDIDGEVLVEWSHELYLTVASVLDFEGGA